MESSDEDTGDDDYLATSQTQRKIAELTTKRDAKAHPLPAGHRLDENGVVQPLSPTTRRRGIIMREMSESLRHSEWCRHQPEFEVILADLILERQKSSSGTTRLNLLGQQPTRPAPSIHTSILPARNSALNLEQHTHLAPLARHRSQPLIHNPAPTKSPSPTSGQQIETITPPDTSRRRPQPNVLGGGLLRPLTRVGENSPLNRTQSSAALDLVSSNSSHTASPLSLEAPAMIRRSTDGDGRASSHEMRRRELAKRNEAMDTSYRSHGW